LGHGSTGITLTDKMARLVQSVKPAGLV
jgi:hypothetical protein